MQQDLISSEHMLKMLRKELQDCRAKEDAHKLEVETRNVESRAKLEACALELEACKKWAFSRIEVLEKCLACQSESKDSKSKSSYNAQEITPETRLQLQQHGSSARGHQELQNNVPMELSVGTSAGREGSHQILQALRDANRYDKFELLA